MACKTFSGIAALYAGGSGGIEPASAAQHQ
jgi:hypothetical protein